MLGDLYELGMFHWGHSGTLGVLRGVLRATRTEPELPLLRGSWGGKGEQA